MSATVCCLEPPLDLGVRDRLRDLQPVALIDLLGASTGCWPRRSSPPRRGTSRGPRAARRTGRCRRRTRRARGERSPRSSGTADRRGPSSATSRCRRAASALTSRRDGCDFLEKNAPSSIAALQHRDLQPADQRLDAVGQILGLEDEVEQHRAPARSSSPRAGWPWRRAAIPAGRAARCACPAECRRTGTGMPPTSKPVSPVLQARPARRPVQASPGCAVRRTGRRRLRPWLPPLPASSATADQRRIDSA